MHSSNVLLFAGLCVACVSTAWAQGGSAPGPVPSVRLRWYGQAFFSLTRSDGFTVAIDPFKEMGYPVPTDVQADVCLVTHGHFDHANTGIIGGRPTILKGEEAVGTHDVKGVTLVGTAAFHDQEQGAKRGPNTIFNFELAGVRFCHLGDIGHLLNEAQVKSVGPVDVLMVPVGGYYTIPVEEVDRLIDQLQPKVVIPMHFKTEAVPDLPIAPLEAWLKGKSEVKRLGRSWVEIRRDDLPEHREIWVLDYQ